MKETVVPLIVVCCYIIGEVYKKTFKEETYKYIPIIVSIIGGLLGILIYKIDKELIFNVESIIEALFIGIVSGASSTGTNQIIKQIFNKGEKENESVNK